MAQTYEPITKLSVTSAGTSFSFTSIPSTYSDLRLIVAGYATTSGFYGLRFNGVSTASYGTSSFYTAGGGVNGNQYDGNAYLIFTAGGDFVVSYPQAIIIDIINYANTGSYAKNGWMTYVAPRPAAAGEDLEERTVAVDIPSAPITSIGMTNFTLAVGSEVSLWGITRA